MLSISLPMRGAGPGDYYLSLAQEDYYLEGGEPPGLWFGKGATQLGLAGQVERTAFRHLLLGLAPNGARPLVQNATDAARQSGWDLTFSAPKTVSTAWSQADRTTRRLIQEAHHRAVRVALRYLENVAGWTRRGTGGARLEQGRLVMALFEHGTSRAQDPQLHTHALLLNLAVRADGTTGTIRSMDLFRHKMTAGALYRAELALALQRTLGLDVERLRGCFELKGVNSRLVAEFSKRRAEIKHALAQRGLSGAIAAKVAALDTRQRKQLAARAELFARWQAVGRQLGWSTAELRFLLQRARAPALTVRVLAIMVNEALQVLTEHQSYFTRRELVRRVAEVAPGRRAGIRHVLAAVKGALTTLVPLGWVRGEPVYTTREMLALERALLAQVRSSRHKQSHTIGSLNRYLSVLRKLSLEQRRAIIRITRVPGTIQVISGRAGTGKSTLLAVARAIWEQEGFTVVGAALSGKAARGLEQSARIPSHTLAKLLSDVGRSSQAINLAAEHFQFNSNTRAANPVHLGPKTVLVVDEAAMIGTRQMKALVEATQTAGAKLVLVGDARQLQPIEAGGPFPAIAQIVGEASLTENRRQREAWAREAVYHFAEGHAQQALNAYAQRGLVSVAPTREAARESLLQAWRTTGLAQPEQHLVLASENAEVTALNRAVQDERLKERALGSDCLRVGEDYLHVRDRVLFTRNSRLYGVQNGALGTVTAIDARTLQVELDEGRHVSIPTERYPHLRLGYAVTTHKAQGMTAENTFILAGGPMQDRELTYVQASRGRDRTHFFIDQSTAGEELADLVRQMSCSHQKFLAHEIARSEVFQSSDRPEAILHLAV